MELLPIYQGVESTPIETENPLQLDKACKRCKLGARPIKTVCMAARGEPGGLLVVSDYPGSVEDRVGQPLVGETGKYLRPLIKRLWPGPVAYDNAIKCMPGGDKVTEREVDACRGYLAQTVREAKPERILLMGTQAMHAVIGRAVPPLSVRKGYTFLGDPRIPVYLFWNPAACLYNRRFVGAWFEDDLKWALTGPVPKEPPWDAVARVVQSSFEAEQAVADLASGEWFAYDCETYGRQFDKDFRLLAVACCAKGKRDSWVWDEAALRDPGITAPLAKLMSDPRVKKFGQNLKFDMLAIRAGLGVVVRGVHGDTRLERKLIHSDVDGSLAVMAELVGMGGHKAEARDAMQASLGDARKAYEGEQKMYGTAQTALFAPKVLRVDFDRADKAMTVLQRAQETQSDVQTYAYSLLPRKTLLRYNARDTVSTVMLGENVEREMLGHPHVQKHWDRLVKPATAALEQVEAWGVAASKENAQMFSKHLEQKQIEVMTRLSHYGNINLNSPDQVAELLFKKLKLPVMGITDGGKPSTGADALEAIQDKHPVVADILRFRQLSKLKGTYADGLLHHIQDDGRIHTNFKLDGARSGRLSSEAPNLQNIPDPEDPESKPARDSFIAPDGYRLVSADFSQVEFALAGMLSGDEMVMGDYMAGGDFHQRTAEMVAPVLWKVPAAQVTKAMRRAAKTINFATLYGQSDYALAMALGITKEEAAKTREAILGRYRKLALWIKQRLAFARMNGGCWTWWQGENARWRWLHDIADTGQDDRTKAKRETAERSSWNTPVQGTASDFTLASLIEAVGWILGDGVPAKLVLTVHDSLMFEVREDCIEELVWQVNRIMTSWPTDGGLKLRADFDVGHAWGSLTKYKRPA